MKYIWIKGERYYYYDKYSTYQEAYNNAIREKRKNHKCKYFIIPYEAGILGNYKMYALYLSRTFRLFG